MLAGAEALPDAVAGPLPDAVAGPLPDVVAGPLPDVAVDGDADVADDVTGAALTEGDVVPEQAASNGRSMNGRITMRRTGKAFLNRTTTPSM